MTGSVETAGSASPGPSRENPFVGPRPLEAGERLWGRDREVRKIDDLLSSRRIVLLCSPSGAGKSSLVQAGLVPRLSKSFDIWGPTRVHGPGDGSLDPGADRDGNRYVLSAVRGFEEGVPRRLRRPPEVLAGQTLAQYVEARPRRRSAPRNLLLIFDQFEEVVTVEPLATEAKRAFFDQLGELLRDPGIWALFILREDYLVALDPYAEQVPTHLKNRFRIDLLGIDGAREAMVATAREAGRDFPAAGRLVHDLATLKVQRMDGSFAVRTGNRVEPVQLQVVCRRLWDALPEDARSIDLDHLQRFGDVTEALAGYYAESVRRIAAGRTADERAIRDWFGERLITAGDVRGQVLRGVGESGGLANELVDRLLDVHLVRAEEHAGATWYELAHDRLVEPVRRDNAAWLAEHLSEVQQRARLWEQQGRPPGLLLADEALAAGESWAAAALSVTAVERRFLDASRRAQGALERERRQARHIRRLAVVASAVGLVAAVLGLVAWIGWRAAERRREEAENLTRAAVAANLLQQGRTSEGNLLALEVRRPDATPTALDALHQALANPVEAFVLEGHTAEVATAVWSGDGTRVATASWDGTARVWNAATGEVTATLEGHTDEVWAVAWNPSGTRLATASNDGTARIWDTATGRELAILEGHTDHVISVAWSGDGRRLATASWDGTARIWDVEGGRGDKAALILRPPGETEPHDFLQALWSGDGRYVLTNLGTDTARVWDATTGEVAAVLRGHTDRVQAIAWSGDSRRVATASADGTARIWTLSGTGTEDVAVLEGHTNAILSIAWSPDGRRVVTASDDATARIWDADSGEALAVLAGHKAVVWSARWSDDGVWIATSSNDETARIWRAADGAAVTVLAGHTGQVTTAFWNGDGSGLVTASSDRTARLWRPWEIGEQVATLRGHVDKIYAAAWSGDGRRVATASWDGTARVWDVPGGDPPRILAGHTEGVWKAAWSGDGTRVATASWDHTVRLWDASTGKTLAVLTGHTEQVWDVAWSGDGARIATASWDGTARLWDSASGELLFSLPHEDKVLTVAWKADGSRLVTASFDGTAVIWDPGTGRSVTVLAGHSDAVFAASWSGDGSRVLTISRDTTAVVWDASSGAATAVLRGHTAPVVAAAWSPDGRRVLTGADDRTARVWDATTGESLLVLAHPDALRSVAWDPDGTRVVTATWDGTVLLWDAFTGRKTASFEGHRGAVWTVDWSGDSRRVLTAADDATARIWAASDRYPDYLRGRIRARLRRCLEPALYQDLLGLDSGEARRRHQACQTCVPRFFERLNTVSPGGVSPWEWQAYEEAWDVYEGCFFERLGARGDG